MILSAARALYRIANKKVRTDTARAKDTIRKLSLWNPKKTSKENAYSLGITHDAARMMKKKFNLTAKSVYKRNS